jgi:hypothetical protein
MLLWKWLPPTLAILDIASIPHNDLIPVLSTNGSHEGLVKICFEDLPLSLTALKVSFADPTLIHFYGASGTNRAMSSNETEQSLLFPPKMKVLECFGAQLTVEAAKQIPCSLTLLNILRLDSQVCGALPRHLKSLTVSGCILTPDLIKNIPPFLTNLEMPLIGDSEAWIDVETGQESAYADLVKRKPEKYGHKMKDISMLWKFDNFSLPST